MMRPDLVGRRDVDADLELALRRLSARASLPRRRRAQAAHDVLATRPRSCASARMAPSEPTTLRTIAGERSARSRSSKARTSGTVSCESFTAPISGTMCRSTCCR